MTEYLVRSEEETAKLAEELAKTYKTQGGAISLIGELGSGKTTFTSYFAKALGIKDRIISPTFVLIRSHPIPDTPRSLHHIDLYRLENIDPKEIGLEEILNEGDNITLIEWADKLPKLPEKSLVIKFKKLSSSQREIEVY